MTLVADKAEMTFRGMTQLNALTKMTLASPCGITFDNRTIASLESPQLARPKLVIGSCTPAVFQADAGIDIEYRSLPLALIEIRYVLTCWTCWGPLKGRMQFECMMYTMWLMLFYSERCATPVITLKGGVHINTLKAYTPIVVNFTLGDKQYEVAGDIINYAGDQPMIQGGIIPHIIVGTKLVVGPQLRLINWPLVVH
jgi:hypothetical protein